MSCSYLYGLDGRLLALLCSYIHVLMVFWSFLAGVATFYCSMGPGTLLPNVLLSAGAKRKVRAASRPADWA